jgi:hypothetical protein
VFRTRPELLVAVSVPVLLLAAVLPWQRDVVCARAGCGTVTSSAWSGSVVWTLVVLAALAVAGAWVLAVPTRSRVSTPVALLTGVVGAVGVVLLLVSVLALVAGRGGFFGFDLPVVETFPVLAVHVGVGLYLAVPAFALQLLAAWTTLRPATPAWSPPPAPAAWPSAAGPPNPTTAWPSGATAPNPTTAWPSQAGAPDATAVRPPGGAAVPGGVPDATAGWRPGAVAAPGGAPDATAVRPAGAVPGAAWPLGGPAGARPAGAPGVEVGWPSRAGGPAAPGGAWPVEQGPVGESAEVASFGHGGIPPRRHRRHG